MEDDGLGDRRRVPPDLREQTWMLAAELLTANGQDQGEQVRRTVVALLEARRAGAREALHQLAAKLEGSGVKADPGLLRALADGYAAGWVEAGDYSLNFGRR